jgi:heme a synthase
MAAAFRLLSTLLPAVALVVIVFGAYVRLSDAGLGCPDWPGCYGQLTVPRAGAEVHLDDPAWSTRPLESGKAWREMIHRYLASSLGLGIVVLAFVARNSARQGRSNLAVYGLVPLVVFQGVLGMWTVTLLLKPLVVSAHLLGGLATLALLWWNFLDMGPPSTTPGDYATLRKIAWAATTILVIQIFLGGWTSANYAALACTDFPTCQGRWWPNTDFGEAFVLWRGLGINYEFGILDTPARTAIHVAHRLGAAVAAAAVLGAGLSALGCVSARLRRVGWCILAALVFQLVMGVSNVMGGLPLPVAVAHNAGAAALLLTLITLLHATRQE